MKSLDEIDQHISQAGEKRIDVLTLAGSSVAQHVISSPGSYYLGGNITGESGKSGIVINSSDVTLDLNGFALIGTTGSDSGVRGAVARIRVCNGQVSGWGVYGIKVGIDSVVDHVVACNNGLVGIQAIGHGLLTNCVASNNKMDGINVSDSGVVSHCAACNNARYGVLTSGSCTIATTIANQNDLFGIAAGYESLVTNCTASHNGVIASTSSGGGISALDYGSVIDSVANTNNNGVGIVAGSRTLVSRCNAIDNSGDGIQVGGDSSVRENHASANGGAGIEASGSGSRIEGNQTRDNKGCGILASAGDVICETAQATTAPQISAHRAGRTSRQSRRRMLQQIRMQISSFKHPTQVMNFVYETRHCRADSVRRKTPPPI